MVLKLGLRNVLRNKRRSFLSCLAIGLGLASLIFTDGFMIGMRESIVKTVTESFVGQAQIHSIGYRNDKDSEKVIPNLDVIESKLSGVEGIRSFSSRILLDGMISSATNMTNVLIVGVDPKKESQVSNILEAVVEGSFLRQDGVVIGKKLSEKLDVLIGEKVVVTFAEPGSGDLVQELFKVVGLFHVGAKGQDEGQVYISSSRLNKINLLRNSAHQIALKFDSLDKSRDKLGKTWKGLDFSGLETVNWVELIPSIMAALELSDQSMAYISIFLLIIVLLGILNNLFMSIFERMYEFGVMQAVGTRKLLVFKMIMAEAFWLGVFSAVLGVGASLAIGYLVNINGIDYSGVELGETTLSNPIFYVMTLKQYIYYPALLFFFTFISAVYPGIHATKIRISDAMKRSL
jgi:ABC-type lipoprotein release transport system permease subunit